MSDSGQELGPKVPETEPAARSVGSPDAVVGSGRDLTYSERLTDLSHPNPYIAYCKSAFWAVVAYFAVAFGAILSSAGVAYLFRLIEVDNAPFLVLMVESFGTAASVVSFAFLLIVMLVETWQLVRKISNQGNP